MSGLDHTILGQVNVRSIIPNGGGGALGRSFAGESTNGPTQESPIPRALHILNERLALLEQCMKQLEQRLGPVMRPANPSGERKMDEAQASAGQVADVIVHVGDRVSLVISQVGHLIDRLAV